MNDLVLLAAVTAMIDGLLAGAGLDQVIKQLPARKHIGALAYSRYFMAADLANGRFWYGALGILAYSLTVGCAVIGSLQNVELPVMALLVVSAGLALVHAFGTSQAAPIAFQVRKANNDEVSLDELFNKFSKWTTLRGFTGFLLFVTMLLALMSVA
jgi:hypothetical protein